MNGMENKQKLKQETHELNLNLIGKKGLFEEEEEDR